MLAFYFLLQLQEQKIDKVCFYVTSDEIPEEFVSNFTVYFLRDTRGMCPEKLQAQHF